MKKKTSKGSFTIVLQKMADEIVQLIRIQQDSSTTDEDRSYYLKILQEKELDPNFAIVCLEALINNIGSSIKDGLSLSLKRILKNTWNDELFQDIKEKIKELIIEVVKLCGSINFLKLFVFSIDSVLSTECDTWDEMFQIINKASQFNSSIDVLLSMIIIESYSSKISPIVHEQSAEFFVSLFDYSFQQSNTELHLGAFLMMSSLIRQSDESFIQIYQKPFEKMVSHFLSIANSNDGQIYAKAIEASIATGNNPMEPIALYEELKSLLLSGPPPSVFVSVFIIFETLFEIYPKHFDDIHQEIIQLIMECSTIICLDDYFELNDGLTTISQSFYTVFTSFQNPEILTIFFECFKSQESSNQRIISALCMLYEAYDGINQIFSNKINEIVNFVMQFLENDSIYVKEMVLLTISDISLAFQDFNIDLGEYIIQNLHPYLRSDIKELIKPSINCLRNVLNSINISNSCIKDVVDSIVQIMNSEGSRVFYNDIIETLSSLIFSTQGDVIPYVGEFLPILREAIENDNEDFLLTKGYGLEALANILQFFPSYYDELFPIIIHSFLSTMESNDLSYKVSLMSTLQKLIRSKIQGLEQFATQIQQFITYSCSVKLFVENEEGNIDCNRESLNLLSNDFILLKCIFKYYPSLIPEDPSQWFDITRVMCSVPFNDTQTEALKASVQEIVYLVNTLHGTPIEFYKEYIQMLKDGTPHVVGETFRALTKLFKYNIPIETELIDLAFETSVHLISGNHRFFSEEEDGEDELDRFSSNQFKNVFAFYRIIIYKRPELFQINEFVDLGKRFIQKGNPSDIVLYIGTLRTLYDEQRHRLHAIVRKAIINCFVQTVEICDFSVFPEPIIAISSIIRNETIDYGDIIEYIQSLFEQEYLGEPFYWATIMNSIKIILSVLTKASNCISIDDWMDVILRLMPVKGDYNTAEYIYSSLVSLLNKNKHLLEAQTQNVLKMLIQTFSLRDKDFSSMKLSEETFSSMKVMSSTILSLIGNPEESIRELLNNDESSISRALTRLGLSL